MDFLKFHFLRKFQKGSDSCLRTGTNYRACSAVVIVLRFGTQGPGFEPGLFHKACYMPLHGCWMKLRFFTGMNWYQIPSPFLSRRVSTAHLTCLSCTVSFFRTISIAVRPPRRAKQAHSTNKYMSTYQYMPVHISFYHYILWTLQYVLICFIKSLWWVMTVILGSAWQLVKDSWSQTHRAHSDLCQQVQNFVLFWTFVVKCIRVHVRKDIFIISTQYAQYVLSAYWYIPVHTDMYWYTL